MKNSFNSLIFIFIALIMIACGPKSTEEIVSESPDKGAVIKISGVRTIALDPLRTSIIVNGYGQSDTLMTEIYAQNFTNENVKFNWTANTECIVTIIQQDDSKRNLQIRFDEDGNSLREVQ